jgi:hypothetical protein
MRKISVLAAGFLLTAFAATAQCETSTTWLASKTEFVNPSGEVHSKPGTVTVTTDQKNIHVVTADGEEELKGNISDYTCNWQDSTNGIINFKSEITDKNGDVHHATIKIEAKDGKIIFYLEAEEEQKEIRLPIDSYTVAK